MDIYNEQSAAAIEAYLKQQRWSGLSNSEIESCVIANDVVLSPQYKLARFVVQGEKNCDIFVGLGGWLMSLGSGGFGFMMIVVGAVGVLAGGATFVWKSPKVKLLQAVDDFLMAALFLLFLTQDGGDIFGNPLICIGIAAFMVWSGFDALKEYNSLSKLQTLQNAKQN